MNTNFAKLAAIIVVGSVAKALFREHEVHNNFNFAKPAEQSDSTTALKSVKEKS